MSFQNPCRDCIGKTRQGEDCCIDVYIILNPEEVYLFNGKEGFTKLKNNEGGVYYTENGCSYLSKDNECTIHTKKPLYCEYYPIFITGDPFIDHECPAHTVSQFFLTKDKIKEIRELQTKFPIYNEEWTWEDVRKIFPKKVR
ncbi:MAG: YkgJ family cysteine cluster protein [Candidatus Hodarchaeales archaeon]|jgi:Fe-S-cluster containining protein